MNEQGPELRIGDAEREAAVAALGEHYAAGRLTKDEYDDRSDAAYRARTAADLAPLFADLPRTSAQRPSGPKPEQRQHDWRERLGHAWRIPVLAVLAVIAAGVIFAHVWPVLIVIGALWWFGVFRGGACGRRYRSHSYRHGWR